MRRIGPWNGISFIWGVTGLCLLSVGMTSLLAVLHPDGEDHLALFLILAVIGYIAGEIGYFLYHKLSERLCESHYRLSRLMYWLEVPLLLVLNAAWIVPLYAA